MQRNYLKNEKLTALGDALQLLDQLKKIREERLQISEQLVLCPETNLRILKFEEALLQLETVHKLFFITGALIEIFNKLKVFGCLRKI
jgi:NifB/MoaA-like Fe-S oxidoreductase